MRKSYILIAVALLLTVIASLKSYEIRYYFALKQNDKSLRNSFELFQSNTNFFYFRYNKYPSSLTEFNQFLNLNSEDTIAIEADILFDDIIFSSDSTILKVYLKGPDMQDDYGAEWIDIDADFFDFIFETGDILIFRSFENHPCDEPRFIFFNGRRSLMKSEHIDSVKKVVTRPLMALYKTSKESNNSTERAVFFLKAIKKDQEFEVSFFCDSWEGDFPRNEIVNIISKEIDQLQVLNGIDSFYMPLVLHPELLKNNL